MYLDIPVLLFTYLSADIVVRALPIAVQNPISTVMGHSLNINNIIKLLQVPNKYPKCLLYVNKDHQF